MKGKAALAFGLAGSVAVLALIAVVYHGVGDNDKASAHMCFVLFEILDDLSSIFWINFPQATPRALLGDGTNNGGTSGQVAQVSLAIWETIFLSLSLILCIILDWRGLRFYQEQRSWRLC